MRTKVLFSAILLAVAFAVACGPDGGNNSQFDDEFSVIPGTGTGGTTFLRVLGSDGTPFVGQVGDSRGSRTVEGIIPQDYVVENAKDSLFGSFTKTKGGRQLIIAQLFVRGQVIAQEQTTVNRGNVSVSSPLPDDSNL